MREKYKIAIPEFPIEKSDIPSKILEQAELIFGEEGKRGDNDQLIKIIDGVDGIIFTSANDITAEIMDLSPNLKVVFKSGSWPENVDFEYAKENGIGVGWTPGANAESVAEFTVLLMLASIRKLISSVKTLDDGQWRDNSLIGEDLSSMTVGLLGVGATGFIVGEILKGFNTNVIGYDPYKSDHAFRACGVKRVPLEKLISESDIISIHCLLTDDTKHIFNMDTFNQMKDSAILINTARGGLIKEEDLIKALEDNIIGGAGLDVFEEEPLPLDSKLRDLDNVILTPHVSAKSTGSAKRETLRSIQGAIDYLNGDELKNATVIAPEEKE